MEDRLGRELIIRRLCKQVSRWRGISEVTGQQVAVSRQKTAGANGRQAVVAVVRALLAAAVGCSSEDVICNPSGTFETRVTGDEPSTASRRDVPRAYMLDGMSLPPPQKKSG